MRRSKNVGVALIGLLVVAAISVAAASGRKPAREERAKTSARVLTNTEADQLGRRFPGLRARTQVTGELLERLFPNTAFYRALYSYRGARVAYLTATSDTGLLTMPDGFNRLLRAYNMEVNDKNKVELAKAFVLTAIGNRPTTDPETEYPVGLDSFPPIIFLDASVTKHRIGLYSYDVELKVRIGEQVEDWCFPVGQGQFGLVLRRDARGNTIRFYNPVVDDPLPSRGQLDPDPNMDIVGDAYVEYDTLFQPWYYVTVDTNSSPTHDTVVFSLSGFPPESTNVYVAVFDPIRHANRYIHRVQMNSGSGSDTWEPPQDSTGICNASAGYADTSDPERTYVGIPSTAKVLTIERLKTGTFPGADTELLKVYFCDQFFQSLPGGEAHAPVFAQYARSAIFESWQTQVNAWGLGMPADADHIHQVFINDGTYWYHTLPVTWTEFGREQKIGIQSRLWYRKHNDSTYSSESTRVNAAAAHEFYHGVQWGLDSTKVKDSTWNWFTEAQARFIQSAQYQDEEFSKTGGQIAGLRQYPTDANRYLTQYLNTSLRTLSEVDSISGYPYCLFWRYMYERFQPGGIQLVRDCYAENVGTGNSISQGKAAIDRAIAKWWRDYSPESTACITFNNFLQTLEKFAIACYLNDTSFHLWYNPHGVYSRPQLTADTVFRLGPTETDSIVIRDNIPCSYGFDLIQLRLNGDVDTLLVTWGNLDAATGTELQLRLVTVYPGTAIVPFDVDSTELHSPEGQSIRTRFVTHGAERICLVITRHDTLDDTCGHYLARFKVKRAVGVAELMPVADTMIAGLEFTPKAVVANCGWMKEIFPATFKIGAGYSDTKSCTLDVGVSDTVGGLDTIEFAPWTTTHGSFATGCSVYIASDTTRSDDTLRGSLVALADTWQTRPALPEVASHGGALASVGDTLIYALRGGYSRAFYCYDVRSRTWTAKESLSYAVGHGASLTWDHGAYLYALSGTSVGGTHWRLFRYDIANNTWSEMPPNGLPGNFGAASALAWGGSGYLFAIQGLLPNNTQGFFRYDTAAEQWSLRQAVPAACSLGASLCWDQAGHIYALCANMKDTFCRYDASANTWYVRHATPSVVVHGAALAYDSLDNGIYAWSGATSPTRFRRYGAAGDTWSARASPPANVGYGGALAGCAGFVYGLKGNGNTDFWRYFPVLSSEKTRPAAVVTEQGTPETNSLAVSPIPVRGPVRLEWQVKEPGPVAVRVFDIAGRVVRTIQNGYQLAGRYSARWDGVCDNGRHAANGVFFYRLDAPGFHKIVKVAAVGK